MKKTRITLFIVMIALLAISLAACDAVPSVNAAQGNAQIQSVGDFSGNSSANDDMSSNSSTDNSGFIVNSGASDDSNDNSASSNDSAGFYDGNLTLSSEGFSGDSSSADSSADQEMKGVVDAVTANTITINGVTYTVDTTEDLTTIFTPGDSFEIEYVMNADGTITIISFSIEDNGSSGDENSASDGSYDDSADDNSSNNSADDDSYDDNNNNSSNSGDDDTSGTGSSNDNSSSGGSSTDGGSSSDQEDNNN